MNYEASVKKFLKEVKDKEAKDEVIECYNYLTRAFANELAYIQRDYELGLCDDNTKRQVLMKSYIAENKLRSYLGLEPLPEIDLSII